MIKVSRSEKFEKMFFELQREMPEIKPLVFEKIAIFNRNPDDTRLDNHKLTKSLEGKWAFSVDSDIRILYEWIGKNAVRFIAIGTHKQVYQRKN